MPLTFKPLLTQVQITKLLGDGDNEFYGSASTSNLRIDAGRGSDYINTGSGNDVVWANGNESTYTGNGTNVYTNDGTSINVGNGNDTVYLGTSEHRTLASVFGTAPDGGGSFYVQTGEGKDHVRIADVDFVSIDASDVDNNQDTFAFMPSFHGEAQLDYLDSFDRVDLYGAGWNHEPTVAGSQVTYHNDVTDASVTITGISHGHNDPAVIFHM